LIELWTRKNGGRDISEYDQKLCNVSQNDLNEFFKKEIAYLFNKIIHRNGEKRGPEMVRIVDRPIPIPVGSFTDVVSLG